MKNDSWQTVNLGQAINLKRGYDLRSSDRRSGGVPVVSSSGITGTHDEAKVKAPGVVTGRYGTLGEVYYLTQDFWPLNTTLYVQDFKGNYPLFVYYLLQSLDFSRYSDKSSVPGLNRNHLHTMRVSLPPLPEQRAIAHILSTLDDKIELNRRMNATLEAMARAIFKSWFVDFDPVHAKACGEQPAGMDAETAALFPDSFEESEVGLIPAGWRVKTIGELTRINEWTLGKRDTLERIEYIEISKVMDGDISEVSVYARGAEPSRARRRLRHGDTVLSTVRPDRGAHFLCLDPSPYLIASTGFAVITPTNVPWSLIYAALTQPPVFEYLGNLADGAAYPAVKPELIGQWAVTLPPKGDILNWFHTICSALYAFAEQNRRESRILAHLRDTLLPRLISGQIRVV